MSFSLENYLVAQGFVTKEQLEKALAEKMRTRVPLIESLEFLKLIDRQSVIESLEKHFHCKYIDLPNFKLNPDVIRMIPENVMKRYMVVGLEFNKKNNLLSVALPNPFDVMALDAVRDATGNDIKPLLTTEDHFRATFEKFYLEVFAEKVVGKVKVEAPEEVLKEELFKKASKDDKEALIAQLFNAIVSQAVRSRATDIHIEPQETDLLIRLRVDGLLQTVQVLPRSVTPLLATRIKVLADLDIAESRRPQDGQIRIRTGAYDIDLRIASMGGMYGEKIAIRVLQKTSFAFGLSQLGMPAEMQSIYEDLIFKPSGIILVTGPVGSGKTTTLYSTISRIRSPEKNILTLEDPIEYELLSGSKREGGVTQVQVKPKIGLTFAAGLRAFLRHDPDIIMVGEIRDKETAEIAITASMIGRLVLSSLHTTDTISAITRLLNIGIEPFMVAHPLLGIVSQRLVRSLCPHCKVPYTVSRNLLQKLGVKTKNPTFFRNQGCSHCDHSGYIGRIGVFELLILTNTIRELVLKRASEDELLEAARKEGFKPLLENALELVTGGITTMAEVMRVLPTKL
ncbi:MAG: type II/IV secretion system protein [Candidatus Saganbacteria bacterium]|nr:type II/IV secretion system protein [Candidatus Saganbacteria bacterium]